jgi:hypothetical protein
MEAHVILFANREIIRSMDPTLVANSFPRLNSKEAELLQTYFLHPVHLEEGLYTAHAVPKEVQAIGEVTRATKAFKGVSYQVKSYGLNFRGTLDSYIPYHDRCGAVIGVRSTQGTDRFYLIALWFPAKDLVPKTLSALHRRYVDDELQGQIWKAEEKRREALPPLTLLVVLHAFGIAAPFIMWAGGAGLWSLVPLFVLLVSVIMHKSGAYKAYFEARLAPYKYRDEKTRFLIRVPPDQIRTDTLDSLKAQSGLQIA